MRKLLDHGRGKAGWYTFCATLGVLAAGPLFWR